MGISHYLVMTAEEIATTDILPEHTAYMACHFSPYGTGLTNIPESLPKNAILILNDRIPFCGHDKALIAKQLAQLMESLSCSRLLLDFERQDTPAALAQYLAKTLSFPVGIAADYAVNADCAVFLPPAAPDIALKDYLKPWTGREIWLELSTELLQITVDSQGSHRKHIFSGTQQSWPFKDKSLQCHYRTEVFQDRVDFFLTRTQEDLTELMEAAVSFGVTTAISLYQEVMTSG